MVEEVALRAERVDRVSSKGAFINLQDKDVDEHVDEHVDIKSKDGHCNGSEETTNLQEIVYDPDQPEKYQWIKSQWIKLIDGDELEERTIYDNNNMDNDEVDASELDDDQGVHLMDYCLIEEQNLAAGAVETCVEEKIDILYDKVCDHGNGPSGQEVVCDLPPNEIQQQTEKIRKEAAKIQQKIYGLEERLRQKELRRHIREGLSKQQVEVLRREKNADKTNISKREPASSGKQRRVEYGSYPEETEISYETGMKEEELRNIVNMDRAEVDALLCTKQTSFDTRLPDFSNSVYPIHKRVLRARAINMVLKLKEGLEKCKKPLAVIDVLQKALEEVNKMTTMAAGYYKQYCKAYYSGLTTKVALDDAQAAIRQRFNCVRVELLQAKRFVRRGQHGLFQQRVRDVYVLCWYFMNFDQPWVPPGYVEEVSQ